MRIQSGRIVMKTTMIFVVLFTIWSSITAAAAGEDAHGLALKCGNEFQKVAVCLEYATGKTATPTKECCASVKDIRDKDPECLCFIIQQTHNGTQQIKSMGIQEAKLLSLPSACSLKNASVADCPRLLGIPANSPDAAIFTSNASSTTPATTTASLSPINAGSHGKRLTSRDYLSAQIAMAAVTSLFLSFSFGFN